MASVDKAEDNKGFAEKEHADFPILSDPEKGVAKAYGVLTPDGAYAMRWVFYIGPDGKILDIDKGTTGRGVSVRTAGADTVAKLEALGVKKIKK